MAAFTFNPLVLSARAVAPAKATRSTRRAAKSALRCSATSEEEDVMGEIGLGDLEDIMAKADGGASVPKFIADLGIEPLTEGFKFLGSDQMTGPGSEMLFVEKFGETLYREAGFTETAEKINGRLAVRTFPKSHPPTYPSPHDMTPSILDRRVASRGDARADATRKIATRAGSKIKQMKLSAAPFPPTHKRTIQKSIADPSSDHPFPSTFDSTASRFRPRRPEHLQRRRPRAHRQVPAPRLPHRRGYRGRLPGSHLQPARLLPRRHQGHHHEGVRGCRPRRCLLRQG